MALAVNLPKHGLAAGDVGAVVHVYKGGKRFMVEFTTFDGSTVAVTKVSTLKSVFHDFPAGSPLVSGPPGSS